MRTVTVLLLTLLSFTSYSQAKFVPTDQFTIEGEVQHHLIVTMAALDTFPNKALPDVIITNHVGVVKNTLTGLKGILVKDILAGVSLQAENPKVLSEFYFVFTATDHYSVVFSWNELYNTETGNNLYVITEAGGKKMKDSESRISILCTTDFKTGRRDLKNLEKIVVERVNVINHR